jgi:hypothetical protein
MTERIDDERRAYVMAEAANRKYDDVASYNEAVRILQVAAAAGVSARPEMIEQRAARHVMTRAIEKPGFMKYIDPYTCAPYGIHNRSDRWWNIAPEIMVVRQMRLLIDHPREAGLEYRDRDQEMSHAADLAGNDYDRIQPFLDKKFEAILAHFAEDARERLYLGGLDL